MPISLQIADLASRTVRSQIGERVINSMSDTSTVNGQGATGIIKVVVSFLTGINTLGNFLVSKVTGFFAFSWTKFWGFVVSAKQFLWNFNWNATDAQLDAQIQQRWQQIGIQFGGLVGNALGWIFCGILPSATVMAFNEPLGAYILKDVAVEAAEEIADNLGALFKQIYTQGSIAAATWAYKNARKIIKSNSAFISKIFGGDKTEKILAAWGETNSKPWSFAIAYENFLDTIPNQTLREAIEEFGEEFDEACTEAGYVVANSVDSWYAAKMLEEKFFPANGEMRFVEITPNRNVPDQKIVLGGNEDLLKPVIIQTLATHQQLGERDIGTFYGTSDGFPVRSIKPEVVLKFYQGKNDRNKGQVPLAMQISIRLMNKDETDFANDDKFALELSRKIHTKLGGATPFKINKGTELYTYHDWGKGYSMNLWVTSRLEARRVVEQILDIQGHSVDDDKLRTGSKPVNTKKTKEKKKVFGNTEEIATVGMKTGIVTFTHAILNIGNGTKPINLYDLTGKRKNVVYRK